jgi:hypothetical protein
MVHARVFEDGGVGVKVVPEEVFEDPPPGAAAQPVRRADSRRPAITIMNELIFKDINIYSPWFIFKIINFITRLL